MAEPLISYRVWKLANFGRLIRSWSMKDIWKPEKPMVSKNRTNWGCCMNDVEGHICKFEGIYSYKSWKILFKDMIEKNKNFPKNEKYWNQDKSSSLVIGEVYNWGKIIEHEFGYRSEFAYPSKIIIPKELKTHKHISKNVKENYGCEVEVMDKNEIWEMCGQKLEKVQL